MKKYFFIWITLWAIIAILVLASGYPKVLGGVAVAAAISFFFMIKIFSDHWSGTVVEVKKEEVHFTDEGSGYDKIIEYAYIKLDSGKIKKLQSTGYKVGNRLEKRRGEAQTRVLPSSSTTSQEAPSARPATHGVSLQTFCEQCGTPLEPGARFCESCGASVTETAEAPSPVQGKSPPKRLLIFIIVGSIAGVLGLLAIAHYRAVRPVKAGAPVRSRSEVSVPDAHTAKAVPGGETVSQLQAEYTAAVANSISATDKYMASIVGRDSGDKRRQSEAQREYRKAQAAVEEASRRLDEAKNASAGRGEVQ